jgi:oligopeptide/dipeptide ABC transporter ATP-binding protein
MNHDSSAVLEVRDLIVHHRTAQGAHAVVEGVSFELRAGEGLALVGESGCGKSVTARSLLRLLPAEQLVLAPASRILLHGEDLRSASARRLQSVRGARIAAVFQEPGTALHPSASVGWQLQEPLVLHTRRNARERHDRAVELLRDLGFPDPERRMKSFPHELSGGQQQRVALAMALACEPDVLVADEPTSALDVTVQSHVLQLLERLRRERGLSVLLVTHDLAVAARACERVAVLYAGRIVEEGDTVQVLRSPAHPYTRALLDALPGGQAIPRLPTIPGRVPSPGERPSGCSFRDRCPIAEPACSEEEPALVPHGTGRVRCRFPLNSPPATR